MLEQPSNIFIPLHLLASVLAPLDLPAQDLAVHVAERDQARAFEFAQAVDVRDAAAIEADDGETNVFVGARTRDWAPEPPVLAARPNEGNRLTDAPATRVAFRKLRRSSLFIVLIGISGWRFLRVLI